mmetsp:Transcript_11178/g.68937  ORF Transcript_11178/g.68937 Transcript_11178/m.68937 type:complete len:248 (+) Transcript_11178:3376-4119(+)
MFSLPLHLDVHDAFVHFHRIGRERIFHSTASFDSEAEATSRKEVGGAPSDLTCTLFISEGELFLAGRMDEEEKKQVIARSIRGIPDFPKRGILFWDITTLMLDVDAFRHCIDLFAQRYRPHGIHAVAGLEARGLMFGAPLAIALGCGFVPIRKPNKLPGETVGQAYDLEYGTDRVEMHVDAIQPGQNVLLVDDLIATGGTMAAGIRLLEHVGANVHECACVIELPELKGREKLQGKPLYVLIEKEGL